MRPTLELPAPPAEDNVLKTAQRWLKPKNLIQLEGRVDVGQVGGWGGAGVFEQLSQKCCIRWSI